jgi:hypothetical protein
MGLNTSSKKVESVVDIEEKSRKCDDCEKPATHFESPLGNPDEAALCDEHFKKLMDSQRKEAGNGN